MRCPKCGFISFDQVESCGKCGKNISKAVAAVHGTTASVAPPQFFQFEVVETEPEGAEEFEESSEFAPEDDEMSMAEEGNDEIEFSLGDDAGPEEDVEADEVEMDLDAEDTSLEENAQEEASEEMNLADIAESDSQQEDEVMDIGEDEPVPQEDVTMDIEEEEPEEPDLNFDEIDISDLGPSEHEPDDQMIEEPAAAESVAVAASAEISEAKGAAPAQGGMGLEDLKVDGLDLDMSPTPVQAGADPDKMTSSVRTGTALDDFDIELGDLLDTKKE